MKKISLAAIALVLTAFLLGGCGGGDSQKQASNSGKTVLKVGATAVPHAEILNAIKPTLAKEGIDLQVVEFSDYVQPNMALADKELDANFFQHIPYLEKFSAEHNLKLGYTVAVHIEPMGVYSKKIKNLSELQNGAQIGIPNDPTNGGRALALLEKAGLITLKEGVGIKATVADIKDNPKNLKFRELEAPQLPRSLDDLGAAVITTNYALEAKLVPTKDALFIETKDSPYANILAVRKGDENRPEIQKLSKVLNSEEVKKFIEEKYKGAVVPAF
ncbi:MAG: MetQ/NlpA family ABC transporter substrate-binding protein [Sporomusaceae bacterium]|nr:MetQ/NlpA family ABC transporter substrate-binding protein [Sporomusaceae bacterium]